MADNKLIGSLLEIGCIKFGEFILKSGDKSPIYIDLRSLISYPSLLKDISEKIWQRKSSANIDLDIVCGVPYTALPISTAISVMFNVPMILKRKSAKDYGTKKILEGSFKANQKCLIIEDVVTTGGSVLETVEVLRSEGLQVEDCIVILDRQQGGESNLRNSGVAMHSLFTLNDVIPLLTSLNLVSLSFLESIKDYLRKSKELKAARETSNNHDKNSKTFSPVLQRLLKIMEKKKSNLCVAADVTTSLELINMAEVLGPHICILKTHIDILTDFTEELITELKNVSKKHNFLLLEDRKFADIGNVAIQQYKSGMFRVQSWADIITVHSLSGESLVSALKMSSFGSNACVLVAQMSSKGALTTDSYAKETVALAEEHPDFVIGFISQKRLSDNPNFLHLSPGVNLTSTGDELGQQYRTIEDAIVRDGIDVVVVGRGITSSSDMEQTAKLYKEASYKAWKKNKSC